MSKLKEAAAEAESVASLIGRGSQATFCSDCDNVVNDTRKQMPTQWLCRMHPRRFAEGFVHPTYWVEHSPFLRCRDVNAGSCPLFVQRRAAEVAA